jgi:hypothetical protein
MRRGLLLALLLLVALEVRAAEPPAVLLPFERDADRTAFNRIDELVLASLKARGIEPANVCSDEVFVRRVYLDVIGKLPETWEVRNFLQDRTADKRARLVDALLARDEFADYWSLKWCDLLRVKAEFPINLWPNAVQAYHRWIHDALHENRPYDQFARELLTSSGSNCRVPPVNFYRALQGREPSAIADVVALNLMGTRTASWPESQRRGMAAFFSRIAYKHTAEWKEEIVCLDPAPSKPLDARFPDGKSVRIPPERDPRQVFADWLVTADNPWFARSIVNRVWSWLMGRGIINEPDDIRPDNPPVNPELLAYLENELVKSGYDLRHIYRLILNSRTYQQSSISRSDNPGAEALFAHYVVRRLDAEVLADALKWVGGTTGDSYSSAIPEPFTFVPDYHPSVALADGSTTSQFLEMFGRPPRDTGLESERSTKPTTGQRLYLLNSTTVQRAVTTSWRLRAILRANRGRPGNAVAELYLTILCRPPTDAELAVVTEYATAPGITGEQVAEDLAWALVNSKEFLYRH